MAETVKIPLCRHIKTNGHRCQSPALTGETFCFFHARLHRDHRAALTAQQIVSSWGEGMAEAMITAGDDPLQIARAFPGQNEFHFPPLEDAESIQFAASMLFHAIAQGHVHLGRARILLHILHIANSSHRRVVASPCDPAEIVRRMDRTPDGVPLAPADNNDSVTAASSVTPADESPTRSASDLSGLIQ
jgi:hypothetical protein